MEPRRQLPRRQLMEEALKPLPPEWPHDPLPSIRSALRETESKVVVLDDDPTGTQTVHGVAVVTDWSVDVLAGELAEGPNTFYVLTNSRSLPPQEARALNAEIGRNLSAAGRRAGRRFAVVSRSDSTLRGHFPSEVEALAQGLGQEFDAWILAPFFLEGGRHTIDDVHYVAEGGWLVPAAETEFARDAAFGFRSSNLRLWVHEKTEGRIPAGSVASVSLEDIRRGGPERVAGRLMDLTGAAVCVVNAASMRDMEVFVQGLLAAERQGKRFLYRTAASFVRARSGQSARPPLTAQEMGVSAPEGGLVVVGSHVPRTTGQLHELLGQDGVTGIEVGVGRLLSGRDVEGEIRSAARRAEEGLRDGQDVVVFTERRLVTGADAESSLSIGRRVSQGLVGILRSINVRPRYILAKGGITASDLATQALGVKRAQVPGQVLPGVPVWELGPESRYPGLKYILFPGNVGGPGALAEIVMKLRVG